MPSKRKQRETVLGEQFSESLFGAAASAAKQSDASLFFVDDGASSKKPRRESKALRSLSAPTERAIARKLAKKLARARPAAPAPAAAALEDDADEDAALDCWADDDAVSDKAKARPSRSAATALAGQSYNPSLASQQALVAAAVAAEERRVAKLEDDAEWWAERRRKAAAAPAPEVDEESDEDDEDAGGGTNPHHEAKARLTQAARNKRKRRKMAAFAEKEKRAAKARNVEFEGLKKLRKEAAKNAIVAPKAKKAPVERAAAVAAAAPGEVPLLDDLTGALRSNKALRAGAVLAAAHAGLAALHKPTKRAAPKKQRRVKYRGAKVIARAGHAKLGSKTRTH